MGSARTHHEQRKRLRRRLEEAGATPEEIAAAVEAKKAEQRRARGNARVNGEVARERRGIDVGSPDVRLAGTTPPPSSEQRSRVIDRDGRWCRYCARAVIEGAARPCDRLTIDHVTPTSRGGSNWASNRVVACETCNTAKADRTLEEWGRPLLPPRGDAQRLMDTRDEIAAAAERSRRQADALDSCTYAEPVRLDDRGFRPPKGDPILTGPARATGATAKAVKRSKALTKWEWDEIQQVDGRTA